MSNISVNKNYRVLLVYLCFAIAALLTAYFMRMAFVNKGYDLGVDVFYHIKMGDLFPHACIDKTFPWTQLSVWKTNFYDKELGFHVLLSGIISFEKILGIKLAPPFNFINLILISLLTLVVILGCYKDRLTSSIMVAPLILFASPLFFLRINMIRPLSFYCFSGYFVVSAVRFLLILFPVICIIIGNSLVKNDKKELFYIFFFIMIINSLFYPECSRLISPNAFCLKNLIGNNIFFFNHFGALVLILIFLILYLLKQIKIRFLFILSIYLILFSLGLWYVPLILNITFPLFLMFNLLTTNRKFKIES